MDAIATLTPRSGASLHFGRNLRIDPRWSMRLWAAFILASGPSTVYAATPTPTPAAVSASTSTINESQPFLEQFPELKNNLFVEPRSHFYFGLGASPLGFVKNKPMVNIDFLQLHWIGNWFQWEILHSSIGMTLAQEALAKSMHFQFRTSPKITLFGLFSLGPVIGYELVSFPNVHARITNGKLRTDFEPFSVQGGLIGGMLSQTFGWGPSHKVQVNEVFLVQNYSTETSGRNWTYQYQEEALAADPDHTLIKADKVFLIEFAILF